MLTSDLRTLKEVNQFRNYSLSLLTKVATRKGREHRGMVRMCLHWHRI